jgi:predicted DsbA family dithiol-disulfide isomerase
MVAITPSRTDGQCDVFCPDCWWGTESTTDQAVELAIAHEATTEHVEVEVDAMLLEQRIEALRDERGY